MTRIEDTARTLLQARHLVVAGTRFRLVEVECYHHAPDDPDPYPHNQPLQRTTGRWAFHRVGSSYRGGTYKGLDLSHGDESAYGGILLRAMEDESGRRIDGPSRLVDELLRLSGHATVAALDAAIAEREADDPTSPLHLVPAKLIRRPIIRTARIGLTFREEHLLYWSRPLRFLTDPKGTRTGRPYLVVALYAEGKSVTDIASRIGSPLSAVRRYAEAFDRGRQLLPATTGTGPLAVCYWLGRGYCPPAAQPVR